MSRVMSPWVLLQRQAGLYPGGLQSGRLQAATVKRGNLPGASRGRGFGAFGAGAVVQQGVTGVKAGVSAAGISTAVGASVVSAIGAGAAAGSVVPIIGTAIGALVGLFASGVLNHRADPEVANFNSAVALYNSNPQAALNIANKYLVLAGLFDLLPGQIKGNIPIYKKYGRMGEQQFVRDLAATIQSAANTGRIVASDTPTSVYQNVVQPWIDSFGFGAMQDTNSGLINTIILGMTAEYLANQQNRWFAVGGQYPFGNLPTFKLPVAPTQAAPPAPVYTAPAVGMSTPQPVSSGGGVFAAPNTSLKPGDPTKQLVTAAGVFAFNNTPTGGGAYQVTWNGNVVGVGSALLWDGGRLYAKQPNGELDQWNGINFMLITPGTASAPAPASTFSVRDGVSSPLPSSTPTVQAPAGYLFVSGAAGGAAVYVDPQGAYWVLSGSTLSPYTGTLSVNGQLVPVQNGLITQAAVANLPAPIPTGTMSLNPALYQNTQAGVSPYAGYPTAAGAPAMPATAAPMTSGLAGNSAVWIAGGLAVLAVIFATARPMRALPRSRAYA